MLTDYDLSDMDDANSGSTHLKTLANTANGSQGLFKFGLRKTLQDGSSQVAHPVMWRGSMVRLTEPENDHHTAVRSISEEFSDSLYWV